MPTASGPHSGGLPPESGEPAPEPPPTQAFAVSSPTVRTPGPAGRTGRPQGEDPDGAQVLDGVLATSALLTVQRGGAGARYLVNADRTTVGRHPASDIFLDDATVSRSHAVFERRGTDYWVHDQGSLNGTYVNGERIETARLVPGDQIQIGKFPMTFQQAGQAGQAGSGSSPARPGDAGGPAAPGRGPSGPGAAGAGSAAARVGAGAAGSGAGRGPGAAGQGGSEAAVGGGPGWWRSLMALLRGGRGV